MNERINTTLDTQPKITSLGDADPSSFDPYEAAIAAAGKSVDGDNSPATPAERDPASNSASDPNRDPWGSPELARADHQDRQAAMLKGLRGLDVARQALLESKSTSRLTDHAGQPQHSPVQPSQPSGPDNTTPRGRHRA